jgi:hypothetical protein
MGKQCPHCREYSFDGRELVFLSYFSARPCTSCGRLVRNDSLRQLLLFLAIMGATVLAYLILPTLPELLLPVGLVLTAGLIVAVLVIVPKPVKADYRDINSTPFDPNPGNDKVIVVNGWDEEQLRAIMDGFMAECDPSAPNYEIEILQQQNGDYWLTFPRDIHPSEFAALVNYLQYPIEFGIPEHSITAVGCMTLSAAFDGIPKQLIGEKAVLYVPENDEDHDVVYVQSESGTSYSYSFQDSSWRRVKAARLSANVKRLRAGR